MKYHDATPQYTALREKLQRLQAEPKPDQAAISRVISQLEQVQLQVKFEQTGIVGNNPNE